MVANRCLASCKPCAHGAKQALPFRGTNAASVWEAATYQGEPWQRFESLPSSLLGA